MPLNKLIGKTILQILTTPSKRYLRFKTDAGDLTVFAYGDCCSNSWFETFENLKNLINEKVLEVIEKEENKPNEEEQGEWKDDVIKFYGFTFKTQKGYADLEMRNSSNGYYGGSICDSGPDRWGWEAPTEEFIVWKDGK